MNNIIWGNSAGSYQPEIHITAGGMSPDIVYCDIEGGWLGEGNIDSDPFFIDTLYNLADSSLCIGVGIDSVEIAGNWYCAPLFDFDGTPRPNPPGTLPDIGAQEWPDSITNIIELHASVFPNKYSLSQNYPNPFNPTTTIEFSLPKPGFVNLSIYNVLGEKVADIVSKDLTAGNYKYTWDAGGLSSGVYFYKLESGSFIQTRKLLLLK